MKTKLLLLSGVILVFLTGCATPFRAPADVAYLTLDRTDSPVVQIEKIWLERVDGRLVVKGFVIKRLGTTDTSRTHLDVTLFDATDRVLRSTVEHFEPRQINERFRRHSDASYQVVLDPLPPGATRIEVRAHEGAHGANN